MSEDTVPCIRRVPDYEIRDGIVYFSSGEWGGCMPLRVFRLAMARAAKAIAEYDGKNAEVLVLRDHAARS